MAVCGTQIIAHLGAHLSRGAIGRRRLPAVQQHSPDPLLMQVIPPARGAGVPPVVLTTLMHSLVLDSKHPLALEIAGTAQQRCLLLRASSPEGLAHAARQLHARLPQVQLRPVPPDADPLRLQPGETVSALELRSRSPDLPLQTWSSRAFEQEGTDPLLGLLAACDGLPQDLRVLSQLAVQPASPTWSRPYARKAQEHALEPERLLQRAQILRDGAGAPSFALLGALALLLVLLLLLRQLPPWVSAALGTLARGHLPALTPTQGVSFFAGLLLALLLLFALPTAWVWLRRRLRRPPYDRELVRQKTMQAAAQARLRLYVLGPAAAAAPSLLHLGQRLARRLPGQRESTVLLWWLRERRQQQQQARSLRQLRQLRLAELVAAYRQYHLAAGNALVPHRLTERASRRLLSRETGWTAGLRAGSHFLTMEELALLWHLPAASALLDLAQMDTQRMRTLPLPAALGVGAAHGPTIGVCRHAGTTTAVPLPADVLRRHLLVCGKSGEGKSSLLTHLAVAAMQQGGLVLLDPHGDLVDHVLGLVPTHREEDVVLLDLSDADYAVGLNVLDVTLGRGRDKAISDLLTTLSHIWVGSWGSRMEIAFAYALRTLYEANRALVHADRAAGPARQYTLLDVIPLLTDESFCHRLLSQVADPFITRWWHSYYDPLSLYMQRDRSDPVLSKIAHFESHLARRIVGQSACTLNLSACIQEERLLLIKLAKGTVGEDIAALLGATLLGLIELALQEQGVLPPGARRPLALLIDEFQVLRGVDWAALAELRKFGATFTLATQSMVALEPAAQASVLASVLASVKQYALFHLAARDAALLAREIGVEMEDLLTLPPHHGYLRLDTGGVRLPPFSMQLHLPAAPDPAWAEHLRQGSRQRYARPAAVVEQELTQSLIRALGASGPVASPIIVPSSLSPSAASPAPTGQAGSSPQGYARQQGGYRGRKGQQGRAQARQAAGSPRQGAGQPTPMNWHETVGQQGSAAAPSPGPVSPSPPPTVSGPPATEGPQP